MENVDILIVGAGLAGAATAFGLAERRVPRVLLVEAESTPGVHASGQNAGMIRQLTSDPAISELAKEGAEFLANPPACLKKHVHLSRVGSLLLGGTEICESLIGIASDLKIRAETLRPEEAAAKVPLLNAARFDAAIWCPGDGVLDVAAHLEGLLKTAVAEGVRVETNRRVKTLVRVGDHYEVETSEGRLTTSCVVNATGAWSESLRRLLSSSPVTLAPLRRHLYWTGPLDNIDSDWPFVWDLKRELYFRPESGGLLLSPCDESPAEPGLPAVGSTVSETLGYKLEQLSPSMVELPIQRSWAGLRTFAPDRRFVVGWDPHCAGLFWVAGLGGHGVTVSAAVGRLAARAITGHSEQRLASFDPARFLTSHTL